MMPKCAVNIIFTQVMKQLTSKIKSLIIKVSIEFILIFSKIKTFIWTQISIRKKGGKLHWVVFIEFRYQK